MASNVRTLAVNPTATQQTLANPQTIVPPQPSVTERILAQHSFETAKILDDVKQAQRTKQSILDEVKAEVIKPDTKITREDLVAIGKLIRLLLPSGKQTNASQLAAHKGPSGLLSQSRGRPSQAIDTFEHYRISQEMRMARQEFIRTKLDTMNAATQIDREDWNSEKMEEKVTEQTRKLAS